MNLYCAVVTQAQDMPSFLAVQAERAPASETLTLLKEEDTVSIATGHEQPISQAPSNVYVITDEDIRHSGGASATYPLIELFIALASVLPATVSPTVDSYTLLNLRGGYRFWNDKAEVDVAVLNALNDRHKKHPLGDTLGNRVTGWRTLEY